MLALFWDSQRRRPRAGVRLATHLALLALLLAAIGVAAPVLSPWIAGPIAFAGVIAITLGSARWLDRRPLADLGLRVGWTRAADLAAGALVGGGAIGSVALLEVGLGAASYEPIALDGTRAVSAAYVAVLFAGVAIEEELVFRGYQLLNLTEGLAGARLSPPRAAALATVLGALGFGLAHAGNEGASLVATLQVALAGGTLLAVGFVLTGDLAFSIGLHFAWNLAQCLLGMPVSGFVIAGASLATRTPIGSDALTGGDFGPEASLLGLVGMAGGTLAALGYVRARYGPIASRMRIAPPMASGAAVAGIVSSEVRSGARSSAPPPR